MYVMLKIRNGRLEDCVDLLTVYMGTHWEKGLTTVEEVKDLHRGSNFFRWGWLVAEIDNRVVGEIIFRTERNPRTGKLGLIRDIGVDVRYQKQSVGKALTRAAEEILREKEVSRIIADSPPEAYNFWMKINYFSRGELVRIQCNPKDVPSRRSRIVKTCEVNDLQSMPRSMRFSNISHPGLLVDTASSIIDGKKKGSILRFTTDDECIGFGAIISNNGSGSEFIADVTPSGEDYADLIIAKTAKFASKWKSKNVASRIPKDQLSRFMEVTDWSLETDRQIPVTRLM
ncbi:MAG: GNAT family N-acetyltransferase [Candidatus Lokiarchaeota archaeon]|nr:GNAT family N-acetyltransferase [Candidatus Lokiarchaeota archaeon]